jgi:hypothetical protein
MFERLAEPGAGGVRTAGYDNRRGWSGGLETEPGLLGLLPSQAAALLNRREVRS